MKQTLPEGPFFKIHIGSGRFRRTRKSRNQVVWGLFLIGLGIVFLLGKLDVIDLHHWKTWWPAMMIVFGLAWIISPGRPRQIASGVTFILIGIWFYACMEHWYGLHFRNAWPLLVVVAGLEMVLTALLDRIEPTVKEEEHHA